MIKVLIKRQLMLSMANLQTLFNVLSCFLISIIIIRIASGDINTQTGAAIMFSIIILSLTISVDDIIKSDYKNGVLEQLYMKIDIPEVVIFIKFIVHSITYTIGFIIITPICILLLPMDIEYCQFILSILMIVMISTLVIMFTDSLILDNRNIAIPLLSLPLLIPSLIFAMMSIDDPNYLMILLALLLIYIPIFIISTTYNTKTVIYN